MDMEEKKTLTREEALRRLAEAKRRKRECIKEMEEYLREEYRRINGQEATFFEAW